MFEFGFAKEDITPKYGISLCGYFNPRPNKGALDRLSVKAAAFRCGKETAAIVSFDLCMVDSPLVARFTEGLKKAGSKLAGKTLFCAIHTHTGPYVSYCFDNENINAEYVDDLVKRTVSAVCRAEADLAPAELESTVTECSTLAFNRRYVMKNGKILTNPGKLNPDIVRPEGPIDPLIPLLAVRRNGKLQLLIANISNHSDTTGGDLVSADWPGRMEAEIQRGLGEDVPVITIIAPQGNINHFNVKTDVSQTSYDEAKRIGRGYAAVILSSLYQLRPADCGSLKVFSREFEAPYMKVTDSEYAEAKRVYEANRNAVMEAGRDFTSEDIAKCHPFVLKFFAERLMNCRDHAIPGKRIEQMLAIQFGRGIGIIGIPAEPFVELGMAVRKQSRFPMTMLAALAMGEIGYVGMPGNYGNGGYETSPAPTVADRGLGPEMVRTAVELLNRK